MTKNCKPDPRPARKRYWIAGNLRRNKVRNLIKNGMNKAVAEKFWLKVRERYAG